MSLAALLEIGMGGVSLAVAVAGDGAAGVGAAGAGYDASNANPCAKAGSGAIPDSTDDGQKAKLQTAVAQLQGGIAATDLGHASELTQAMPAGRERGSERRVRQMEWEYRDLRDCGDCGVLERPVRAFRFR